MIDAIELVGYSRLDHNHIHRIRITFTETVQLILGSNGSGKSSLLKEFSPLPADFDDYHPGGSKTVYITHHDRRYVLTSTSDSGKKYSFVCDGEELNPGRTRTIYLELVRQHFGITPDIHRVMTNEKSFTRMSKEERRAWFTMCSQVDYTFALKYYQRLKERHRDLVGSLKRTQERLVQERQQMLSDSDLENNRLMLASIDRLTRTWLAMRTQVTTDLPGAYEHLKQSLQDALKHSGEYETALSYVGTQLGRFESPEAFMRWGEQVKAKNAEMDTYQRVYTSQAAKLADDLEMLRHNRVGSIHDLKVKAASHQFKVEELISSIDPEIRVLWASAPDVQIQTLAAYFSNIELLHGHLKYLPADPDKRMTAASLASLQTEVESLSARKSQLEYATTQVEDKLRHLKEHQSPAVTCPQCDHRFSPDNHAAEREILSLEASRIANDLRTVSERLDNASTLKAECASYLEQLKSITGLMASVPQANCIWEHIINRNMIRESPDRLSAWLSQVSSGLQQELAIRSHLAEIEAASQLQDRTESDMSMSIGDMELEMSSLEYKLHALATERRTVNRQLDVIKQVQTYQKFIANWERQTADTRSLITQAAKQVNDAKANTLIDMLIWDLDREQTRLATLVAKQSAQQAVVASLEQEVNALTDQIRIAKLAVQSLNPNDGLIAKGLTGFINQFLARMNAMMMKIWRYPIELLPVETESDSLELTYKFKFTTNHTRPKEDVALGSSAMQEIIDLAFRTVSMAYLNIPTYPLFLDEFGAKFDKAHRDMAFHVVSALGTSDFSQIFMVSHHEQSYSVLRNCGVIVLCDKNIELPSHGRFNQHVTINEAA